MSPPPDPDLIVRFYRRCTPWFFAYMAFGMMMASAPWGWAKWCRSLTEGLGLGGSLAVTMLPMATWFALVIAWERRLMRRVRHAEYRLCPQCGYSLVGRTGSIACPECGRPCEMDNVERMWRAFRPRISGMVVRKK